MEASLTASTEQPTAVVFDVGRVLIQWDLRALFCKLIDDKEELDWFLANVVTEEWHFQHDAGRPLDDMVPERQTRFPEYADHIAAYRTRFLETIPGPVPGSAACGGSRSWRWCTSGPCSLVSSKARYGTITT